jgi:hypothetical protein
MKQKWVIIDETEAPVYWCEGDECVGYIMEFDTEEDANIFLAASAEIPFVDTSMCYPVSVECHMGGSRNYTGFIPVANGDSIDLVRRI